MSAEANQLWSLDFRSYLGEVVALEYERVFAFEGRKFSFLLTANHVHSVDFQRLIRLLPQHRYTADQFKNYELKPLFSAMSCKVQELEQSAKATAGTVTEIRTILRGLFRIVIHLPKKPDNSDYLNRDECQDSYTAIRKLIQKDQSSESIAKKLEAYINAGVVKLVPNKRDSDSPRESKSETTGQPVTSQPVQQQQQQQQQREHLTALPASQTLSEARPKMESSSATSSSSSQAGSLSARPKSGSSSVALTSSSSGSQAGSLSARPKSGSSSVTFTSSNSASQSARPKIKIGPRTPSNSSGSQAAPPAVKKTTRVLPRTIQIQQQQSGTDSIITRVHQVPQVQQQQQQQQQTSATTPLLQGIRDSEDEVYEEDENRGTIELGDVDFDEPFTVRVDESDTALGRLLKSFPNINPKKPS